MLLSILLSSAVAQASGHTCRLAPHQEKLYLAMSYQDFDQRLDGGWRVEFQKKCIRESAHLIDRFRITNRNFISADEVRILNWHAAQLYGMLGQMRDARPRFQNSLDPKESVNSPARWNSYVRGTLAYFKFDLPGLKAARAEVALGSDSSQNLTILDGMIRCFDLPRSEAYSEKCQATD